MLQIESLRAPSPQATLSLQLVQQAAEAQGRGQGLRASLWHKLETYCNFLVVSHFNS